MPVITRSEFNRILVCNQFGRSRRCASMYFRVSVPARSFYHFAQEPCIQHAAQTLRARILVGVRLSLNVFKMVVLTHLRADGLTIRFRLLYFIKEICSNICRDENTICYVDGIDLSSMTWRGLASCLRCRITKIFI